MKKHNYKEGDKHIVVDADGCLLDWVSGFNAYMENLGYTFDKTKGHMYALDERFNLTAEEVMPLITAYNNSEDMMRLHAIDGAINYVSQLKKLGYTFSVVTSLSDCPIAKCYRQINLMKLFGTDTFKEVVCLATGACKKEVLTNMFGGSGLFFIEDYPINAQVGFEAGLKPILIQQEYNLDFTTNNFPIVPNKDAWKSIFAHITQS